ncbi:3-deoxy-manno-octulosonate cytidylyltransferase [Flavobacteriaceae bacterium MHTCC 0001]
MKIISMIPARYGASRFPGKLMQDLKGKSVILRTYEATVATQLFDDVIVVTDSAIIFDEIANNGGKVVMSTNEHHSGSDRIAEAVENLDVDVVVNVQGDEPFTDAPSLKKLIEVFKDDTKQQVDLASLMVEITDVDEINNPNAVKVVVDQSNFALYFSRSPIPYPRDKTITVAYYKHKGVYAFRKQALMDFHHLPMQTLEAAEKLEQLRYLEYGKRIKMVKTESEGVEIDTPEDLERAKKLWK